MEPTGNLNVCPLRPPSCLEFYRPFWGDRAAITLRLVSQRNVRLGVSDNKGEPDSQGWASFPLRTRGTFYPLDLVILAWLHTGDIWRSFNKHYSVLVYWESTLALVCSYPFFFSAEGQTQGLIHARHVFYHWATSPALGFLRQVSLCNPGWSQLMILLPQPPKCWDYKSVPPCLAIMGISKKFPQGSNRPLRSALLLR
jgi:hypothetical protein